MPTSATSLPVDHQHRLVSEGGWEEPHPGRRLSCFVESALGCQQKGGRAAQRVRGSDDSTVGHSNNLGSMGEPKPSSTEQARIGITVMSACASTAPRSISPPAITPDDSDSAMSGCLPDSPSSSRTCATPEMDMSTDGVDKMRVDSPQSPNFLVLSPASGYEDLSSYLDGHSTPGSSRASSMVVMGEAATPYSYTAPMQDMYGWDAEWDRRLTSKVTNKGRRNSRPQLLENLPAEELSRRRSGSKPNLLHRVLSVGKVPSRKTTSRRSRFNS